MTFTVTLKSFWVRQTTGIIYVWFDVSWCWWTTGPHSWWHGASIAVTPSSFTTIVISSLTLYFAHWDNIRHIVLLSWLHVCLVTPKLSPPPMSTIPDMLHCHTWSKLLYMSTMSAILPYDTPSSYKATTVIPWGGFPHGTRKDFCFC